MPTASQMVSGQPQAARMASPRSSARPNEGSAMCSAWVPWWTAQVKKIAAVAEPSGLTRSWLLRARGTTIARAISR